MPALLTSERHWVGGVLGCVGGVGRVGGDLEGCLTVTYGCKKHGRWWLYVRCLTLCQLTALLSVVRLRL